MSHGPQRTIEIPPHWWKQLEEECRSRCIENVEQLCKDSPRLSARTIRNAEKQRPDDPSVFPATGPVARLPDQP